MHAEHLDIFEAYIMRLALKAQNQTRVSLQTLLELKMPKHITFVQQVNIGNQVQVNNDVAKSSARKKNQKPPNKLLAAVHEQQLDTGTASATGRANSTIRTMEEKHWTSNANG